MRIDKNNLFFCSDLHFNHKKMVVERGFDSTDEMNEKLIENWNSVVDTKGVVFFLGDFAFANYRFIDEISKRLNGKIYFIKGNHDKLKFIKDVKKFTVLDSLLDIWVADNNNSDNIYQHISLCHYPIHTWNRKHYGSWHLFGHTHKNFQTNHPEIVSSNLMIDVGVDCHDLFPVSYQEVKELMQNKEIYKP